MGSKEARGASNRHALAWREMRMVTPILHGVTDPVFIGTRGVCGYVFGLCGRWREGVWLFALNDYNEWIPCCELIAEEIHEV